MNNALKLKLGVALFFTSSICVSSLHAEPNGPSSFGFTFNIPVPAGDTTDVLNNGFGFGLDYTYRPEASPLGIRLDMIYESFGLTSDVLNQINRADSGYATTWGFGLSAVLTPRHVDKVRPYIQAGPGFFYEYAQASRFTGGGGYYCDPWFGCYGYSSSDTIADWSTWRLGWVGGAGINIEFDSGGAFYVQTQYYRINNAHANTEFIPIGLGYKWTF